MADVEFSVLGSVRVRAAGRAVELGPGRRRSTLAALLVDAGHVVSVDLLTERVWDGNPPVNPAASLHTYVSRLRSALRTVDQDGREITARLLTEPPGYRLVAGEDDVDAVRFQSLLSGARQARTTDPRSARTLVGEALALWRGDPYSDIAADFARVEAARLGALHTGAQELAIELDLELGRHGPLVEQIAALLSEEPLREPLHAAMILALYRNGRPAEALRHFDHVRRLLADELGIDPSHELQALHAAVLRQDRSLDVPELLVGLPEPRPEPDAEPAPGLRMVGRDRQLGQLLQDVTDAWRLGDRIGVAVVGEAGIGKSRLLEEAGLRLKRGGSVIAWGRCWEHDGAPALWPWVQVLRAVAGSAPAAAVKDALAEQGSLVTRLVPELGDDPATVSTDEHHASLEESQVQLFDGVTAFFRAVAERVPLLLVLEDMHWSDPASRRLTEYLVSNLRGPGLALLLSVRSPTEEAASSGPELLASLARTGRVSRIGLTGLDVDAVRLYVADRTRTTLDDRTTQALVDRTEGNPFFVGEIVRLLVTDEADDGQRVTTEVPDSVREVILRRLQRLGDEQMEVLRSASVVGRSFDLDLLEEVSGAPPDTVDEAVDRATAAGFLCTDPDDPVAHRFTHALVQQALMEATGPARRRRLHARIARSLRSRDHGGARTRRSTERLVHHLTQAGGHDHLTEAVQLCLATADAAGRRSHYVEVERVLQQGLELIGRLDGLGAEHTDDLEIAIRVRLCSLYDYFYGPAYPATVTHRERALDLARRVGSSHDRMAVLTSATNLALGSADFVATAALVQEMLVTAEATGDRVLEAAAHYTEGMSLIQRGHDEQAISLFSRTIELAGTFDTEPWADIVLQPLEVAWGWRLLARTLLGQDDTPQAQDDLDRCRRHTRSSIASISANGYGLLALRHVLRDEREQAAAPARDAVRVASASGNTPPAPSAA